MKILLKNENIPRCCEINKQNLMMGMIQSRSLINDASIYDYIEQVMVYLDENKHAINNGDVLYDTEDIKEILRLSARIFTELNEAINSSYRENMGSSEDEYISF
ncbi:MULTISPECIES: hypothetical protein [unclassified Clostridium]|uniref:hypothetical protein n=1 Tax=unclassified Clostridium TaxID=2614128 RepID=UPI00029741AF|nr:MULTISPECIES: hypothetical protein [unclassified Clostridium]EKQ57251.1 MAG: hypothetical protein A370_01068 [Clostridium sp. Maddingley MBC34-26]